MNQINIIQKFKDRAKRLKKELTAVYYAYQHPGVGKFPKLIIFFTVGYALSPIDLIPDFIPVLGYLDDLIILPALIALSIKLIPKHVIQECRDKAEKNPLELKKNWVFAFLFILVWIILITVIVLSIVKIA